LVTHCERGVRKNPHEHIDDVLAQTGNVRFLGVLNGGCKDEAELQRDPGDDRVNALDDSVDLLRNELLQ